MEATAIFNKAGNLLTDNGLLVGDVDCEDSAWVIPQDMHAAFFSYSRSDAAITSLDIVVNNVVIDSITIDSDKGTGAIDLPVSEGDELCIVNNAGGQAIKDVIVVIAFADAIPITPGTPLYELTLEIFYRIAPVAYAKYLATGSTALADRGLTYEAVGENLWSISEQVAIGAKAGGA